jgi:hypothetical protein
MRHISDKNLVMFLAGDISTKGYGRVSRHLKRCKKCRDTLTEWQKIIRVTEDYTEQDKNSIHIPEFAGVSQSWQEQEEEGFPWIRYWLKPAIATAAVVVLTILGLLIFPQPKESNQTDYPNSIVLVDEYGYEGYEIDEEFFTYLEETVLSTIVQDETLRNDILYSTSISIAELASYEVMQQIQHEIQETKINPVTLEE